jgi:hypothetical protein
MAFNVSAGQLLWKAYNKTFAGQWPPPLASVPAGWLGAAWGAGPGLLSVSPSGVGATSSNGTGVWMTRFDYVAPTGFALMDFAVAPKYLFTLGSTGFNSGNSYLLVFNSTGARVAIATLWEVGARARARARVVACACGAVPNWFVRLIATGGWAAAPARLRRVHPRPALLGVLVTRACGLQNVSQFEGPTLLVDPDGVTVYVPAFYSCANYKCPVHFEAWRFNEGNSSLTKLWLTDSTASVDAEGFMTYGPAPGSLVLSNRDGLWFFSS